MAFVHIFKYNKFINSTKSEQKTMKMILNKRGFKNLDISIIISTFLICIFSVLNVFSTTHSQFNFYYANLQIIWIVVGFILVGAIILIDDIKIKSYSAWIYWASVVLLLFNDITSKAVKGASSWIRIGSFAIEPGEFVRIGLILMLSKKIEDMDGEINNFKNLSVLAFYALIPIILIVIQPNIGLTLICFFITLGIFFISGLNIKIIYAGIIAAIPLSLGIWFSGILKMYQKQRIISFLNPGAFEQDIAYQLTQSMTAIGSGGILGKGFLNGSLISGGFIPEVHTDFIFASVGEEWGFIGAVILIILYFVLISRIIKMSKESPTIMSRLVCIGVASSLLFSVFQNIGMTIGIMPISGITLPFMSYGGSSILANFISVGLVLSLGMKKSKISF